MFPTDIITSVTVGAWVAREGDSWLHVVPFILLTRFLLALPRCSGTGRRASRYAHMRAGLAWAPGNGTIRAVCADASIVDEPLGPRSHRFTLSGTIDMEAARELERQLRDVVLGGTRTVIIDLSDLTALSSGLIGALIRTQRSLNWRNGRLLLACESAAIRHQLADLNDLFELVDARPRRR